MGANTPAGLPSLIIQETPCNAFIPIPHRGDLPPGGRTLRLAQRTLRLTGFAVPTKQKSWRAAWILLDTPYTWAVAAGHLWQITIEI